MLREESRLAGGCSTNTFKTSTKTVIGRCNSYSSRILSTVDLHIGLFLFLDDHGCDLGSRKLGTGLELI
jgi:hypothetical protein